VTRYFHVIKCTQRGEEEEHATFSSHRDYDLALDECESLQDNYDKPSYVNYYVSQYHNGMD